jgi:hypothetical protein
MRIIKPKIFGFVLRSYDRTIYYRRLVLLISPFAVRRDWSLCIELRKDKEIQKSYSDPSNCSGLDALYGV